MVTGKKIDLYVYLKILHYKKKSCDNNKNEKKIAQFFLKIWQQKRKKALFKLSILDF